jgi:hypothetical protein
MAQQIINVGTNPNDGTGDTLRGAFVKTDENFDDLYTNKQNTLVSGTNIKTINGNSLLGSGNLTIGGITGSGTDNYIPKFNGTTALENSLIFDDGTNVGIGTVTPGAKLQIDTDSNFANGLSIRNINAGTGAYGFIGIYTSTGGIDLRAHSAAHSSSPSTSMINSSSAMTNGLLILQAGANPIRFNIGGGEQMRISGAGNVGIGTSSPLAKLHVVGTSSFQSDFAYIDVLNDAIYMYGKNNSGMYLEDGLSSFGHNPGGDFRGVRANYNDGVWFANESGNKLGLEPVDNELFVEGMIQITDVPLNTSTPCSWIKVYNYDDAKTYFLPIYL